MTRETAYCFGADLGGTKLAAALADARGRIVAEMTEPTDRRGGAYVAEQIAACADKLAQAVGIEVTRARRAVCCDRERRESRNAWRAGARVRQRVPQRGVPGARNRRGSRPAHRRQ